MITTAKCIEVYKKHGQQISEAEAEKLRHLLYLLANIRIDGVFEDKLLTKCERKNVLLNHKISEKQ
jgi:hypothetical protein